MNRYELEHIILAAGAISGSKVNFIIGSQAILCMYPEPPAELLVRYCSRIIYVFPVDNSAYSILSSSAGLVKR
jgi:hypothetical protein